jgi:tetratricopeptide (TPR) repeat protein
MAVVSYSLGDLNKAIIQAIKAMNLDPRNSFAPYNLAFALHDKKDYKQAIRWYREAIRIDSTYRRDSVYTASCSALGNLYNSIEQPIDAILILSRAMDQYPQSQHINYIYKNLGNAYLLREEPDSALKYLILSMILNP